MNIIVWIIFGGLVGWIASLIMSTDGNQGILMNIIVGIGGALLGGFLARMLGLGTVDGFDITSLLIAIVGSIIILAVVKAVRRQA